MTFSRNVALFFEIFWGKIFRKKALSSPKMSSLSNTIIQKYLEIFHFWIMALPNDDVFEESISEWWCCPMTTFLLNVGFFFQLFMRKKWNWLTHRLTLIFFSANKHSSAPFCSVLRCSLWCGAVRRNFAQLVQMHLYGSVCSKPVLPDLWWFCVIELVLPDV